MEADAEENESMWTTLAEKIQGNQEEMLWRQILSKTRGCTRVS